MTLPSRAELLAADLRVERRGISRMVDQKDGKLYELAGEVVYRFATEDDANAFGKAEAAALREVVR